MRAIASLCLGMVGCSAWVDAGSYRGEADANRADAAEDVGDTRADDADSDDTGPNVPGPNDTGPNDTGPNDDANISDAGQDVVTDAPDPDVGPPEEDAGPGPDVGPCPPGPDTDRDGVVDVCDQCAGFPDRDDDDRDGTPNGCDDWPCGIRPVFVPPVTRESITIHDVRMNGRSMNTAVVAFDETFRMDIDWEINDTLCETCTDQIEIGFTRIGRLQCIYNDDPPTGGVSGTVVIRSIPIPAGASGLYELRFNLGRDPTCPLGGPWFDGLPPNDQSVGGVCVTPAGP